MHVEGVEEVLYADVVRGESGRVVRGESGRGPCYGSRRVSVIRGVDQDDVIGRLQRLQQDKTAGTPVEAFNVCGKLISRCKLISFIRRQNELGWRHGRGRARPRSAFSDRR